MLNWWLKATPEKRHIPEGWNAGPRKVSLGANLLGSGEMPVPAGEAKDSRCQPLLNLADSTMPLFTSGTQSIWSSWPEDLYMKIDPNTLTWFTSQTMETIWNEQREGYASTVPTYCNFPCPHYIIILLVSYIPSRVSLRRYEQMGVCILSLLFHTKGGPLYTLFCTLIYSAPL